MSGSLQHSPANIVRQLLINLGVGTDPDDDDDWPVFYSNEPDGPDSCITLYDTAGRKLGRFQNSGEVQEDHGIQIRIRDARPKEGYEKARVIAVSLDENVLLNTVTLEDNTGTGDTSYTVHLIKRTSGPISLGKEEPLSRRNIWTINAVVALRQNA